MARCECDERHGDAAASASARSLHVGVVAYRQRDGDNEQLAERASGRSGCAVDGREVDDARAGHGHRDGAIEVPASLFR